MTMTPNEALIKLLDQVSEQLWELDLDDALFERLKKRCASLTAQIAVHRSLQGTIARIQQGPHTPLPNTPSRIYKFLDSLYGTETSNTQLESRWQQLRKLDCETFLLISIAYTPLDISKMHRIDFDYLIRNARKVLDAKPLSQKWIFRKEIQLAIAEKSELPNIGIFKKRRFTIFQFSFQHWPLIGYHELEFLPNDSSGEQREKQLTFQGKTNRQSSVDQAQSDVDQRKKRKRSDGLQVRNLDASLSTPGNSQASSSNMRRDTGVPDSGPGHDLVLGLRKNSIASATSTEKIGLMYTPRVSIKMSEHAICRSPAVAGSLAVLMWIGQLPSLRQMALIGLNANSSITHGPTWTWEMADLMNRSNPLRARWCWRQPGAACTPPLHVRAREVTRNGF